MFIHIGQDVVITAKEVVSINDLHTTSSEATKEFLEMAKEEGFIKDISNGNPKSFIITSKQVYLSPISSLTIKKRANFLKSLTEEDKEEIGSRL